MLFSKEFLEVGEPDFFRGGADVKENREWLGELSAEGKEKRVEGHYGRKKGNFLLRKQGDSEKEIDVKKKGGKLDEIFCKCAAQIYSHGVMPMHILAEEVGMTLKASLSVGVGG